LGDQLARYLTKGLETDQERAWVIFAWVCFHVKYDIDGLKGKAPRLPTGPDHVLRSRLSVCAGYAGVFQRLAEAAGLECKTISGHARNSSRRVGQDIVKEDVGSHAWNAFRLGSQWLLADSTWGAGTCNETFNQSFRPHFFGVPPRQFALSHWPEEPRLQLLGQEALTYGAWTKQPIVSTSEFFGHSLEFLRDPATPTGIISGDYLRLVVPKDTFLLLHLNGQKLDVDQQRDQQTNVVTMSSPKLKGVTRETELHVFVRQGSPYGSFELAAKYLVQPR